MFTHTQIKYEQWTDIAETKHTKHAYVYTPFNSVAATIQILIKYLMVDCSQIANLLALVYCTMCIQYSVQMRTFEIFGHAFCHF